MRPRTVLVVDDHADSRMICEIILSRRGFQVMSAGDGKSGLEMARLALPGVILLDIALPRMDGWSVMEELRRAPETAAIPVIVFTAHSLEFEQARAKRAGCAGYLVKPCSPQDILDEVERCIARELEPTHPPVSGAD